MVCGVTCEDVDDEDAFAMKAGHCLKCNAQIWRIATDWQGGEIILWPSPLSRYVAVLTARDAEGKRHLTPGIGYCAPCCPPVGGIPPEELLAAVPNCTTVAEIEMAHARYAQWFTPGFGEWLKAHAKDQLKMEEGAITRLMDQWERDRAA